MAKQSRTSSDLLDLAGVDRVVHEPARLLILMVLFGVDSADFTFLLNTTELTWGNLSSHVTKLEEAGYVKVKKDFVGKKPRTMVKLFVGKKPRTMVKLTDSGRRAIDSYRNTMQDALKNLR
jgi:DNA-binding MarR family transcriptional regulator